jgi:hypothetical protein
LCSLSSSSSFSSLEPHLREPPDHGRVDADIGNAGQPASDALAVCAQQFGIDPHPDPKHQL